MTDAELKREAMRRIDSLPTAKLRVAAEFLAYLQERASDEATEELLAIPGLLEDVREAQKGIGAGEGVDWRSVRGDV